MNTWRALNKETKIQFVELGLTNRAIEVAEAMLNFHEREEVQNYLGLDRGGVKYHLTNIYKAFQISGLHHFLIYFMPKSELTWIGQGKVDTALLNPLPTGSK